MGAARSNTIVAAQVRDFGEYNFFPHASSSKTGAQNRDAIQAAIDAAPAGTNIHLPAGVLELDKAATAEPGAPNNDYCLRGKSNIRLIGHGTTLKLADDQLVFSPSVRQLAIISISTLNTGAAVTEFGIRNITLDGNAAGQGGYSTYAQLGATMGVRGTPGLIATGDTESITWLQFEDIICKDFFGNAAALGGGSSSLIQHYVEKNVTVYRCGEGWEVNRGQYGYVENSGYIDDNPDTLQGVGAGYVTAGDTHEYAQCFDWVINGIWTRAIGLPTSGGGSGLDIGYSNRIKVFGADILWASGIQVQRLSGASYDAEGFSVDIYSPVLKCPAAGIAQSVGLDIEEDVRVHGGIITDYSTPLRLNSWDKAGFDNCCTLTATDLQLFGGGQGSNCVVNMARGCYLRATNLQIETDVAGVRGIYVQNSGNGVAANTRIELSGGRIVTPLEAIVVAGLGSSFSPIGQIIGLDASGAGSGAWPFKWETSGLFDNILFRDCRPTSVLLSGTQYAGAEIIIANGTVSALPLGSKNQVVFLKVPDVANPFSPSGTFTFGNTSAAVASRVNLVPYLITSAFENGAGVFLRRDDSGVWQETGRIYPVHQNRAGLLSFTAPITLGATYNATPVNFRMPAYGRLTAFRVRFSNLSAARTAGTIAITPKSGAATISANLLNINGTNTTGDQFNYPARLGNSFAPDTLYRYEITVSGDFTNSGGATDLVLEMAYET